MGILLRLGLFTLYSQSPFSMYAPPEMVVKVGVLDATLGDTFQIHMYAHCALANWQPTHQHPRPKLFANPKKRDAVSFPQAHPGADRRGCVQSLARGGARPNLSICPQRQSAAKRVLSDNVLCCKFSFLLDFQRQFCYLSF